MSLIKSTHLRRKVLKCSADVYFNRQCLKQNLTPDCTKMKVPNTSFAAKFTKNKITKIIIKDEIKFLYIKKEKLNKQPSVYFKLKT